MGTIFGTIYIHWSIYPFIHMPNFQQPEVRVTPGNTLVGSFLADHHGSALSSPFPEPGVQNVAENETGGRFFDDAKGVAKTKCMPKRRDKKLSTNWALHHLLLRTFWWFEGHQLQTLTASSNCSTAVYGTSHSQYWGYYLPPRFPACGSKSHKSYMHYIGMEVNSCCIQGSA